MQTWTENLGPCGCCGNCKYCMCYRSPGPDCAGSQIGDKKWAQTITVPERFNLPVKVVARGFVDDVFVLDGDATVFGQNPNPYGEPAHNFDYTWTQNNRTFTIEALDTYGFCLTIFYTICFMPLNTADPSLIDSCPEQQSIETLPGSATCEPGYDI